MNILHITPKPIYPKVDGGCVAMADFLSLLANADNKIDHVCIATPKHPFQQEVYDENLNSEVNFLKSFWINTDIKIGKLFSSLVGKNSYQISRFYSEELKNYLSSIEENYDIIILESIFLLPYFEVFSKPVYVRTHNLEHQIWKRRSQSSKNPIKKWIFQRFTDQVENFESSMLKKVSGIISISEDDTNWFINKFPKQHITTIPLSVTVSNVVTPKKIDFSQLKIGFLGAGNWQPNREAIEFIDQELYSNLKHQQVRFDLLIGGYETDKISTQHVTNRGTIADLKMFFEEIDIFIAPLRSGSGLKIKVIEALLNGKPIIGTSIAFDGLNQLPHKNIAHSATEFTEAILKLAHSENLNTEITDQQAFLIAHYSEQNLSKKLQDFVNT